MATSGRPARRPLSRQRVVSAGLRVVARRGVAGFGMRQVATELGTAPMSLYRHVANRRELMLLMLDDVARGIRLPPASDPPRERLTATFLALHDQLGRHPWAVDVLTQGELLAPHGLRVVEQVLAALDELGLPGAEAAGVYGVLWSCTVGHLVSNRPGAERNRAERWALAEELMTTELPRVRALADAGGYRSPAEVYRAGLAVVIDAVVTAPRPGY
ncbi:MAG: TetR/AcrR family transcriptional regulator [Dermatophilaceae bacterium]